MEQVLRMVEDVNCCSETIDDGLHQSSGDPLKGSDGHVVVQVDRTDGSRIRHILEIEENIKREKTRHGGIGRFGSG